LPDSMPAALPAPPVWWCKHAAYGIGLTLRHVTPNLGTAERQTALRCLRWLTFAASTDSITRWMTAV
jgi:hypothetical protein